MRISDWSSDVCSSDLSNTLMKMGTRMTGSGSSPPSPLVSSWGGVTSWIIVTSPSAGEAITPSPEGVALLGSRKNAATHRVMPRSEEHTSELQSLMRSPYAVFCVQKKKYLLYDNTQTQYKDQSRTTSQ